MEILRQLLIEVLEINDIVHIQKQNCNELFISRSNNPAYIIDIYQLGYKCKEWGSIKGYKIYNKRIKNKGVAKIKKKLDNSKKAPFICIKFADTEIEAIFDICQWILDNKEG